MKELILEATVDNLEKVMEFIDAELEQHDCPVKTQMRIDVAVEELFVNIANYAYAPGAGNAEIRIDFQNKPAAAVITFSDSGKPFDPLAKEDPDVTLSVEERKIGGLGIFMVKKSMDDVRYEYKDGKNNLTIVKNLF
ncbi:Anti-sigma regulatory factor (Ser/Thr protein kinase) [Ruminococcaceae bacterium FB2012]|nr:Anti-sigma regulatory factor (Ser/Thr protein kinase) [Ruminococcaceae bacterium FB2012]